MNTTGQLIKWIIITFISTIIVIFALMYYRLGIYKDAQTQGVVTKPFKFLRTQHVGPYHEVTDAFLVVEEFAKENNIRCQTTFGHYIDDPDLVDPDRLRSYAGCLLSEDTDLEQLPASSGKQVESVELKTKEYLKITFDGSPAIGPMKVYPLAESWSAEGKKASLVRVIEVYKFFDDPDKMITEYYFPLIAK